MWEVVAIFALFVIGPFVLVLFLALSGRNKAYSAKPEKPDYVYRKTGTGVAVRKELVNSKRRAGYPRILAHRAKVFGLTRHREKVWKFIEGAEREIFLKIKDNGVQVFGVWRENGQYRESPLGWLNEEISQLVRAERGDVAARLVETYRPIKAETAGLRIEVTSRIPATKRLEDAEEEIRNQNEPN